MTTHLYLKGYLYYVIRYSYEPMVKNLPRKKITILTNILKKHDYSEVE